MATEYQLNADSIPYYTGVQGFVVSPYTLGAPQPYQISDDNGNTSHTFDAAGEAERVGRENLPVSGPQYVVHHVYAKCTARANGSGCDAKFRLGTNTVAGTGTGYDLFEDTTMVQGVVINMVSDIYYEDWNGDPWTIAVINNIFNWYELTDIDSLDLQIFDTKLYVSVVMKPNTTIIAPTNGSYGVALAPLIKWKFSPLGDPQYQYQVAIWDYADWLDPGFDPETTPSVYDSGIVTSSALSHQVPTPELTAGAAYVLGVRQAKNMNFAGQTGQDPLWGDWQPSAFHANYPPLVDITAPLAAVTTTRRPIIQWGYGDYESTPPLHHYIKVWTLADYLDPDFDPYLTPALRSYDSDLPTQIDVNHYQWKLDPALQNGNYVIGCRATQQVDGVSSAWDLQLMVIATTFVRPNVPIMTVTPEPENGRVKLTIQRAFLGEQPEHYSFIRSYTAFAENADNINWVRPFDWTVQNPYTGSEIITFYDYEMLPNVIFDYAGFLWNDTIDDPEPSGPAIYSTIFQLTKTWLKDPLSPELNMSFPVEESWLSIERNKSRSTKRPLGRKLPVQRRGVSEGDAFTATFIVLGSARHEAMEALINSNRTLLFQTSRGSWYVDVASVSIAQHLWSDLHGEPEGPAWKYTLGFQEVEAP